MRLSVFAARHLLLDRAGVEKGSDARFLVKRSTFRRYKIYKVL